MTHPERKRRDWPVIIGLFCGGVVANYLWLKSMQVLMNVHPGGRGMKVGNFLRRIGKRVGKRKRGGLLSDSIMMGSDNIEGSMGMIVRAGMIGAAALLLSRIHAGGIKKTGDRVHA